MVLPLIPLIGLGFFVTWLVLYGMTHGLQTWLASLLSALAHPAGSLWKRTVLLPVSLLAGATLYVFRSVGHAISQAAAHGIPRVADYFGGVAAWLTYHATIAGDFAVDVADGFDRVVTHTIPHAVSRAIAVPIHEVKVGLRHTERDLELLRRYARGIDRLVRDTIVPDIRRLAHAIDITLPRALGKVRSRVGHLERDVANPTSRWVKAIWKRGWILVGAGLMVKFLIRKFPYLFCRNSTNALKQVCGMNTDLLTALLATTVALDEVNLRDFVRTLQTIESEVVGEIGNFIKLGD